MSWARKNPIKRILAGDIANMKNIDITTREGEDFFNKLIRKMNENQLREMRLNEIKIHPDFVMTQYGIISREKAKRMGVKYQEIIIK